MEKPGKAGIATIALIVLVVLGVAEGLTIQEIGLGPLSIHFGPKNDVKDPPTPGPSTTIPGPSATTAGPRRPVVPPLAGRTRQAADQALASAGLRAAFVQVDADVPIDQVVETTPASGTEVDAQSTVRVEISRGPFAGTWTNADPRTRSLPQITLEPASAPAMTLHVWGACSPTWCDWGTTTATPAGIELRALYDQGFATEELHLSRSGSQLIIRMHTHFKDNSGRADYDSTDTMNRKPT